MYSPLLASLRAAVPAPPVAGSLLLSALGAWVVAAKPQSPIHRGLSVAVILTAGAVLTTTLMLEARFQWVRARVLAADTAQLERLGRHFVVGYRDAAEIGRLIERRAIGGVF